MPLRESNLEQTPKISVVTPSFNQAAFLEETIDSVLSQGYPNLEYVIIDGGSTDGSLETIRKYEKYLHYWCSEPDDGHYAAINKGFRHTTGTVMGWLNSDDLYFSFCLRTIGSIFSQLESASWITSKYAPTWDASGFCIDIATFNGFSRSAFLNGAYLPSSRFERKLGFRFIQQESTFWRRGLWERVGAMINTKYDLAGDFDLWRRFYMHEELYSVASPLGGFRQRRGQRSESLELYVRQARESLAEMETALGKSVRDRVQDFATRFGLRGVPLVGEGLRSAFGYPGRRIVREQANEADGRWGVARYNFL